MCFIQYGIAEPKIAEEDIICYKWTHSKSSVTKDKFFPPFYPEFQYERRKPTPHIEINPIQLEGVTGISIDEGYHSEINEVGSLREGIFVIPKGAKYYNNGMERVSEQLIYLGPNTWWSRVKLKLGWL